MMRLQKVFNETDSKRHINLDGHRKPSDSFRNRFFPKNIGAVAALTAVAALSGCTITDDPEPEVIVEDDPTLELIAEAADEVRYELGKLSAIQQADAPEPRVYDTPTTGPLATHITFSWSGRLDQAVEAIAEMIGYEYIERGNPPAQPRLVNVDARNKAAFDVLQDIGWQGGDRTGVVVSTGKQRVEVIYAERGQDIEKLVEKGR